MVWLPMNPRPPTTRIYSSSSGATGRLSATLSNWTEYSLTGVSTLAFSLSDEVEMEASEAEEEEEEARDKER